MPRRSGYTVTAIATAYLAMLRRSEGPQLDQLRANSNPYRRPHLAASWEAGWLAYGVRLSLGEGMTNTLLSRTARAAWLRGHQAREAMTAVPQPQED